MSTPPPPPNSVTAGSMGDADHSAPQPQRRPWAAPRLASWGREVILGHDNLGPDSYSNPCGSPCSPTCPQTLCPGAPQYTGS